MKKIFSVIFGIFLFFMIQTNACAILSAPPPNPDAKPVLIKTQGLKVYIPQKDMLATTMKHAFMDWQKHTGGNFTFEFVGTKSTANLFFRFCKNRTWQQKNFRSENLYFSLRYERQTYDQKSGLYYNAARNWSRIGASTFKR